MEQKKKETAVTKREKKPRGSLKEWLNQVVTSESLGQLIFRCIMFVLVPYLYLFACGFLDSYLLKGGFAYREAYILFVFFSLMIFWIIGFTLGGISIYRWVKRGKTARPEGK